MLRKPGAEIGAKARGNSGTERQATGRTAAENKTNGSSGMERQAIGQAAVGMGSGRQRGNRQQGNPLPAGGRKQEVWE